MTRNYIPMSNFCFVKQYKDRPSGLYLVGQDSEIYEIIKLPEDMKTEYQDFQVGTKIIVKNNWRGIKAYEENGETVFCIDFPSIIAIVE